MLVVSGTITIEPSDVERFRPAAAAMMAATHQEEGCHQYVFSEDVSTPGSIQVFELWQSQEELDAHFATPHMAEFRAALGELTVLGREIHAYDVSNARKL